MHDRRDLAARDRERRPALALATIGLDTETDPADPGGKPVPAWSFSIVDRRTDGPGVPVFEKTFPDACQQDTPAFCRGDVHFAFRRARD